MASPITWVDIPVKNVDRAIRFYGQVLNVEMKKEEFPTLAVGLVPHETGEVGVCLFPFPPDANQPSENGPLVYLNCEGRLGDALELVERFGGRVIKPKHSIGGFGWRAIVMDCEGNRIALHSREADVG